MSQSNQKLGTTTQILSDLKERNSQQDDIMQRSVETFKSIIEESEFEQAVEYILTIISSPNCNINIMTLLLNAYKNTSLPENWIILFNKLPSSIDSSVLDPLKLTSIILNDASIAKPALSAMLIISALNVCDEKALLNLLTEQFDYCESIKLALPEIPLDDQKNIIKKLIPLCITKCNAELLHGLQMINPIHFAEFVNTLDSKVQQTVATLIGLDSSARQEITKTMGEFSNGFGRITYEGALITCAQIGNRKSYPFKPTILNGNNEFEKYLTLLKTCSIPLRERFVISGSHWISGDIQIDQNGKMKILFIDSLGGNASKAIFKSTIESMEIFAKTFPNAEIFFSCEKRQHSVNGCSVYALDDVRHLYTTERYLNKKYDPTGLFGYLSDQKKENITLEDSKTKIMSCHLPLTLQRTKMSSSLEKDIEARPLAEQAIPIGKTGKTAAQYFDSDLIPDSSGKKKNVRLEDKLKKMSEKNAKYLLNTNKPSVQAQKKAFSLEDFKKRIESSSIDLKVNPPAIKKGPNFTNS